MLHIRNLIKYMKKNIISLCSLFLLLCSLSFCLSGCDSIDNFSESNDWETTTQSNLSYYAKNDTESISNHEINTKWKDYELTANEIDYDPSEERLDEDGYYTTQDDVATYLIEYETLPDNFITKKEAKELGWTGGSLEPYGENMCIGGDYFGNYEGLLPDVDGRTYYECDIDTMGAKKRGGKRIIYSDDGQIYYTDDHYESFTLIYGTD